MKRKFLMALLMTAVLVGCGEHKKETKEEEKRIFQIESVDETSGLHRMQVSRANQEISCKGKKFQLFVERTPADDLPKVKSDLGLFADNRISVKIARSDGSALFTRTFTKLDFASYLPESYLKRSVLEGIVFDDVTTSEKNEITLAGSVSYPMSDLYIPFKITIDQSGKMSIRKDEDMGDFTPLEDDSDNN